MAVKAAVREGLRPVFHTPSSISHVCTCKTNSLAFSGLNLPPVEAEQMPAESFENYRKPFMASQKPKVTQGGETDPFLMKSLKAGSCSGGLILGV